MRRPVLLLFAAVLFSGHLCLAQGYCPANIGFENGSFTGWNCLDGHIDGQGNINMVSTTPANGKHTLYKNASPQAKDKYGGFPVNCPNGSNYSIKIGNDGALAEAQGVSYSFTVPAGQNDYSIIFNYAVVLQNPGHVDYQQPKFTSKVFDVTSNKYLECGTFQFIAAANLPGFKESPVEKYIFYKDWAPVTIKLTGYAGKTIRLEFTANDCTQGVHFGYAYLDVDENCTSPITGNTYCNGSGAVILKAPYGFRDYRWFDEQSNLVGSGNTLKIDPPPPGNTKFRLEIVPFPGQGCQDTLHTTIIASSDFMKLQVKDTLLGCPSPGVDITAPAVTTGSTAGLSFQYFTDSTQAELLSNAAGISTSGKYFIKATSPSGCTEIKPVYALIKKPPALIVTSPEPVCTPGTVDLTAATVTAGSEAGITLSYWQDTAATVVATMPSAIMQPGKYFIKAVDAAGCSSIVPVTARIAEAPRVVLNNINSCGSLLFSNVNPTAGSDPSVKFSYGLDPLVATPVSGSQLFSANTTIYVKAMGISGCAMVKPVQVIIHPFPVFTVTDPPPATRPATVDLASTVPSNAGISYSYWFDDKATKAITLPHDMALTGTYYIKGTDANNCSSTNPVNVKIIDPLIVPPNVFSPNNDGINDSWQIPILAAYATCTVEITTRNGFTVYSSVGYQRAWDGTYKEKTLPADTYYYIIRLSPGKTAMGGSVTIVR